MQLVKLNLTRFRRFRDTQCLNLNDDLIALVGPNEAGKSTVLDALLSLGRLERLASSDVTRRQPGNASLSGLFILDEGDRAALGDIHGGADVNRVWVKVASDQESSTWDVEPCLERDLAPRRECLALLTKLQNDPALAAGFSVDPDWPWDAELLTSVLASLESANETLSGQAIESLESLSHRLSNLQPGEEGVLDAETGVVRSKVNPASERRRHRREATAASLLTLAQSERQPTPFEQIVQALGQRVPNLVQFTNAERELKSEYQVADVANSPPAPLANLCRLAELDLSEVQRDLAAGRLGHVEKLVEDANDRLKERFRGTWSQSDVYPRFGSPSEGVLHIHISSEGELDYTPPEERSDGLRWFIALHSFLSARGDDHPILLVDEAETHLHYDAQADLIATLMEQRVAAKVIYSTHSFGCLPPDLGCGIRAVLPIEGTEHSRIVNNYWVLDGGGDDQIGYSPLLFAMGAQLLSLTVPRYALVTEGPSDAILLPSLFREAAGIDKLPYRVVPGLARLAEDRMSNLPSQAGSLVCLADGDDSGGRICRRLEGSGLSSDSVLSLEQIMPGCTLEDLIEPSVFINAVNTELTMWGRDELQIGKDDLPSVGRWAWVESEARRLGKSITDLSKPRVAQRIVNYGREDSTSKEGAGVRLAPGLGDRLLDLHRQILTLLRVQEVRDE
jgi:hypothetical protein